MSLAPLVGPGGTRPRLRSALFVDFDNVYIGLQRLDPTAAEAFATDPGHWLGELESGSDEDGDVARRFLVRACYLNPSRFSQFRPNFTRAGFQVVDCPSLTQQGKSSADINLVLDAVDALAAPTRYDEFVIVSADADFTPLALRCRAADRRVTIITASPAAAAYRAVADTVVTADDLAELVTQTALVTSPAATAAAADAAAAAAPADPTTAPAATGSSPEPAPAPTAASTPAPAVTTPAAADPAAQLAARRAVLQRVRSADRPVPSGAAAQAAQQADPTLPSTRWAGTGGFFAWLTQAVPELGAASRPAPGFVWDPKRFGEADLPGAVADTDPTTLQRQVITVTDVPGLSQANYRVLLTALTEDVRRTPFERIATSRRVRDTCQEAGAAVGRSTVNFVISGVLYAGLTLGPSVTVQQIATAWVENVVGLCRGARIELTEGDVAAIRSWVGGGLLD